MAIILLMLNTGTPSSSTIGFSSSMVLFTLSTTSKVKAVLPNPDHHAGHVLAQHFFQYFEAGVFIQQVGFVGLAIKGQAIGCAPGTYWLRYLPK